MDERVKERIKFYHLLVTLCAGGFLGLFGSFVAMISLNEIRPFVVIISGISLVGTVLMLILLVTFILRLDRLTSP